MEVSLQVKATFFIYPSILASVALKIEEKESLRVF